MALTTSPLNTLTTTLSAYTIKTYIIRFTIEKGNYKIYHRGPDIGTEWNVSKKSIEHS